MYVCCHPSNQGEDVRAIQSRVQVGECFWVKRGKALVPGCLVSKDLRVWKAFIDKFFQVWDFSLPFNLTEPKYW